MKATIAKAEEIVEKYPELEYAYSVNIIPEDNVITFYGDARLIFELGNKYSDIRMEVSQLVADDLYINIILPNYKGTEVNVECVVKKP